MTAVLIGKKELFAFAERFSSSRRLKDYHDLEDADVLCRLFNAIFPLHSIRPASCETHSTSQRALHNWESLYRAFAHLHIPITLLNPLALINNQAEQGFTTLALFYFLFYLSKRIDFTAEFSTDISEELTTYLQSINSIASLLLGEAVEWSVIPEQIAGVICASPSFHILPQDQEALEAKAASVCRAILASSGKFSLKARKKKNPVRKELYHPSPALHRVASLEGNAVQTESALKTSKVDVRPCHRAAPRADSSGMMKQSEATSATSFVGHQSTEDCSTQMGSAQKERQQCGTIKQQYEELLAEREKLRTELAQSKAENMAMQKVHSELMLYVDGIDCACRKNFKNPMSHNITDGDLNEKTPIAIEEAVSALLEDITDPETGDAVDVTQRANLLHCMLLEHLRNSPGSRTEAQSLLWSIVSAFHVVENRLVTAVDIIDRIRTEGSLTKKSVSSASTSLPMLSLREQHAFEERAAARDALWKRVCSELQQADRYAMEIAKYRSAGENEFFTSHDECIQVVDQLLCELGRLPLLSFTVSPAEMDASVLLSTHRKECTFGNVSQYFSQGDYTQGKGVPQHGKAEGAFIKLNDQAGSISLSVTAASLNASLSSSITEARVQEKQAYESSALQLDHHTDCLKSPQDAPPILFSPSQPLPPLPFTLLNQTSFLGSLDHTSNCDASNTQAFTNGVNINTLTSSRFSCERNLDALLAEAVSPPPKEPLVY